MEDIALFKLVTGEELIAQYKVDEGFYFLKAPRKIVLAQLGPNQVGPKMFPWLLGNHNGIFPVVSTFVVTVSAEIEDENLKNAYVQETTGIDLSQAAPSKLII